MASFHKLKIKDIKRETEDCVSISFEIPTELKTEFSYKQGQYLTLRHDVNGEDLRRSYSVCSSPVADDEIRVAVKRVEGGKMSTFLNNGIQINDTLDVMSPMGNFFTEMTADQPAMHFVAFAAGSGITPIMSLLKTALSVNPNHKFTLIYGNKNTGSTIFKSELDALQSSHDGRLTIHYINSREENVNPFYSGRISPETSKVLLKDYPDLKAADAFFLCGPYDMIMSTKEALIGNGVLESRIHFELFTTADAPVKETIDEGDGSNVESQVTIVLDGEETDITVAVGEKILDAVLDAGMDAPYACTGGSCCTCRAKIQSGNAEMEVNYALTDEEVRDGYILTCQSLPTTSKMVVDYDAP